MRAMEKFDLKVHPELIYNIYSYGDHLFDNIFMYFKSGHSLPTAILTDNDIITIHTMKALRMLGIKVPNDISIVGFDNMPMSEMLDPPLTTVDVSKYRMGVMSVNRLAETMHATSAENVKIEVSTRLISRKSVRNLNES